MKILAYCIAGLSLTTSPLLHSAAAAQIKDGFREYRWGSPMPAMEKVFDLRLVHIRGEYVRYDTNIEIIENVALRNCHFEFVSGRFCGIVILVSGRTASRQFFDLLRRDYGEGQQTSPIGCQWLSPVTHVYYDEDRIGNAYVYIYSIDFQGNPEHLPAKPERSPRN
jgi:hypothetical protein